MFFDNNTVIILSRHAPRCSSQPLMHVPRGEKQFLTGSVSRVDRALLLRPDPQGVGV